VAYRDPRAMAGYEDLPTERARPGAPELDLLAPGAIARLVLEEEARARAAVEAALPAVEALCDRAAAALRAGGRLLYAGAGTSGRLGVLDASEMGPTFGARPGQVVALLAGAPRALTESVEAVEDDARAGADAMRAVGPAPGDLALGVSMSGTAAWVGAALEAARAGGAATALLTANPAAWFAADLRVVLDLGPEVLAGSTRLKGGSATKIVLNMVSTSAMCASGAVFGGRMVRVRPVNRKLRDRAERLVSEIGAVGRAEAARLLADAGDDVPVACVMARLSVDAEVARERLARCGGRLREVLPR